MIVEAECSPDYTEWTIRVSDAPAGTNLRELAAEFRLSAGDGVR